MSPSSAHSTSGSSSHSSSFLQLENNTNIKEHKDTLSSPKDILSQPEDALPLLETTLPLHETTLSARLHEDTLPHLADTPPSPLLHKDTRSTMPLPRNRSKYRDVRIFDTSDRDTSIGGLIITAGVTNTNLYSMIEVFVIFTSEYILRNESDTTIEKDDSPVLPGNYYIDSPRKYFFNPFFL